MYRSLSLEATRLSFAICCFIGKIIQDAKMNGMRCTRYVLIALISGALLGCAAGDSALTNECRWDPQRCMHEGSYEEGEEDYAEQQAKELNKAASRKMRRSSGFWW